MHVARGLARNVAILLGSQVVTSSLSLVIVLLLPHYLGDVGLGRLAFAQAVCAVLGAATVLGTNLYIVREVAADRSRVPHLLVTGLITRAPVWLLASLLAIALLSARHVPAATLWVVAALTVVTLVNVSNGVLSSVLQGAENMGWKSVAAIADTLVVLLVGVPALVLTRNPLVFCAALLAGAITDLTVNSLYFRNHLGSARLPRRSSLLAFGVGALPFLGLALAQGVYGQIDTLTLGLLTTESVVGWFAAANRLSTVVVLVPVVLTAALFPVLSRLVPGDEGLGGQVLRKMLDITALVAFPISAGLAVVASRLFVFLDYPAVFEHSIPILVVLSASWSVTAIVMVLGSAVLAGKRRNAWAIGTVAIAPVFLALNLGLIPIATRLFGNGGIGAAAANLLGESAMVVLAIVLLPAGTLHLRNLGYAARVVTACLVMVAAVASRPTLHLPQAIPLGVAVYTGVSMLLRTLAPAEIRLGLALVRGTATGNTGQLPAEPGTSSAAESPPADGRSVAAPVQ